MKKKIAALSAMILCMAMVVSGTMAYFTQDDTAVNVITTGGIKINLVEKQMVDGSLVDYPNNYDNGENSDLPIKVMPGSTVSKIVTVENVEEPAYIRVRYEITVTDKDGNPMQVAADKLAQVVKINEEEFVDKPGSYWSSHQTGPDKPVWYYYNVARDTGEVTKPLFTEVVFDGPKMGNEYQNCEIEINVIAEAVQAKNNPTDPGETYLAAGWAN